MANETTQPASNTLPVATKDLMKSKLQLALNQEGFQAIQTQADALVFNEDNTNTIAEFLTKGRNLLKALDAKFKEIKAPYLSSSKACDEANNDLKAVIASIFEPKQKQYETLCANIERKRREEEAERQRVAGIKSGIESNLLAFSQKIAATESVKDLLSVESLINLEKGRRSKYAEFLDDAVKAYETLTDKIAEQKEKVRKLDKIKEEQEAAKAAQDDEKFLKLQEQKEEVQQAIEEKKEDVQLAAIEAVTNTQVTPVSYIATPKPKARYSKWVWEISEATLAAQQGKVKPYYKVVPNEEVIEEKLKELKAGKDLENKTELFWNDVRFYLDVRY